MFPPFFSHFWAAVVGVCSIGISTMMAKATCSSTWLYPLRPLRSCIVAKIFLLHSQLNQLSCGYIHVSSKVVCVRKEIKLYKCHWCITSIYLGYPYERNRISIGCLCLCCSCSFPPLPDQTWAGTAWFGGCDCLQAFSASEKPGTILLLCFQE